MSAILLDGNDLTAIGWQIQSAAGLDDGVSQSLPIAQLAAGGAALFGSTSYTQSPRTGTLTFVAGPFWAYTDLDTALNKLKQRLGGKTVVVTSARRPSKQLTALFTGFPADALDPAQFVAPYRCSVALAFTAPNPYWQDQTPQSVSFATATATPSGTAPCWATVTITNSGGSSISNPHIVQQDHTGATAVDLPTTCTIPVGDAIEIDGVLQRCRRRTSGVWTVDMSIVASGFPYPRVTPRDADYDNALWGTIQSDKGSGGLVYTRNWA